MYAVLCILLCFQATALRACSDWLQAQEGRSLPRYLPGEGGHRPDTDRASHWTVQGIIDIPLYMYRCYHCYACASMRTLHEIVYNCRTPERMSGSNSVYCIGEFMTSWIYDVMNLYLQWVSKCLEYATVVPILSDFIEVCIFDIPWLEFAMWFKEDNRLTNVILFSVWPFVICAQDCLDLCNSVL